MKARILGILAALLVSVPVLATDFYVSPNASANGTGTLSNPWKLQTALNQPSSVHPGDTIWMRGGTYTGVLQSHLTGTSAAYITLRQYPGERATIDENNGGELDIYGSFTIYWGFEVTNSNPSRPNVPFSRVPGLTLTTPDNKFVNLIVHDTGQGFGFWDGAYDSEISGCLVYYNGNANLDHGIYAQNQDDTKVIADNILFNNYGHGLHIYGSDTAHLDNFTVDGNTSFNNGLLGSGNPQRNLLLGGSPVAHNPTVTNNNLYYTPGGPASAFDLGYAGGCSNADVTGNYVANNTYFVNCMPVTMTGNTFYGTISGFTQSQYPNNSYYANEPPGQVVRIRPNAYEAGRANITVFNWSGLSTVSADLSSVLQVGSTYEVRNAANFYGAPVLTGTYDGGSVALPLTGLSVAAPVGFATPSRTGPEFNVFVVITTLGPGEFYDVPAGDPFHASIQTIALDGITAGCSPGYYCPDNPVTRAQMSVFLLKSEHGATYVPPPATGAVFVDVPTSAFAADWIEEIAVEGITAGCLPLHYCPDASITRAEMAVFLLKTRYGAAYTPPPATGTLFGDVSTSTFAAAWIEDLANRGITAGCGNGNYCPGMSVTRRQMAPLLVTTFGLQ